MKKQSKLRRLVFVPMSADFLHFGHINLLLKANKYGKVVVGLMTDKGINSYKKKKPFFSYKHRKKTLEQLKLVNKIVPLNGLEYVDMTKKFKFKYFVHGDDWKKGPQSLERDKLISAMKKWGGKVIEPKYTKGISSSLIKKLIKFR